MREILFRGKRADTGEWAEGDLFKSLFGDYKIRETKVYYGDSYLDDYNIIPETVGQYTGLTDKNGNKIFEGDVVKGLFFHSCPVNAVVAFDNGSFGLLWDRAGAETFWAFTSICNVEYEVIGNIHDNPELLKGE